MTITNALRTNNVNLFKELFMQGVSMFNKDTTGKNAFDLIEEMDADYKIRTFILFVMCKRGTITDDSYVKEFCRRKWNINVSNEVCQTPLMIALINRRISIALTLAEAKASTHVQDKLGNDVAHYFKLGALKAFNNESIQNNISKLAKFIYKGANKQREHHASHSNKEPFEILTMGSTYWNAWRRYYPKIRINLEGANFSGVTLHGFDFSKLYLLPKDFSHSSLIECSFNGSMLRKANFANSNITKVDFSNAKLEQSTFKNSIAIKARFSNANLALAKISNSNFSKSELTDCGMMRTSITESNFTSSDMTGVSFYQAQLKNNLFTKSRLNKCGFSYADVKNVDFTNSMMSEAIILDTYFEDCDFSSAKVTRSSIERSQLINTNFTGSSLTLSRFSDSNLSSSTLRNCDLYGVSLFLCNVNDVCFSESYIYGLNVWDISGEISDQKNLVITRENESKISVDNIKTAQFLYLLIENPEIREVLDTITSKAVLILGRFSQERKIVLDEIKNSLRTKNYLPILFDFDKPSNIDLTGTVETLARLSRFIIADLTDPSCIPFELGTVVPYLRRTPIQPIIFKGEYSDRPNRPFAMFNDLKSYPWVLNEFVYNSKEHVLTQLVGSVIEPAENLYKKLRNTSN